MGGLRVEDHRVGVGGGPILVHRDQALVGADGDAGFARALAAAHVDGVTTGARSAFGDDLVRVTRGPSRRVVCELLLAEAAGVAGHDGAARATQLQVEVVAAVVDEGHGDRPSGALDGVAVGVGVVATAERVHNETVIGTVGDIDAGVRIDGIDGGVGIDDAGPVLVVGADGPEVDGGAHEPVLHRCRHGRHAVGTVAHASGRRRLPGIEEERGDAGDERAGHRGAVKRHVPRGSRAGGPDVDARRAHIGLGAAVVEGTAGGEVGQAETRRVTAQVHRIGDRTRRHHVPGVAGDRHGAGGGPGVAGRDDRDDPAGNRLVGGLREERLAIGGASGSEAHVDDVDAVGDLVVDGPVDGSDDVGDESVAVAVERLERDHPCAGCDAFEARVGAALTGAGRDRRHVSAMAVVVLAGGVGGGARRAAEEVLVGEHLPLVEAGVLPVDAGVDHGDDGVVLRVGGRVAVAVTVGPELGHDRVGARLDLRGVERGVDLRVFLDGTHAGLSGQPPHLLRGHLRRVGVHVRVRVGDVEVAHLALVRTRPRTGSGVDLDDDPDRIVVIAPVEALLEGIEDAVGILIGRRGDRGHHLDGRDLRIRSGVAVGERQQRGHERKGEETARETRAERYRG